MTKSISNKSQWIVVANGAVVSGHTSPAAAKNSAVKTQGIVAARAVLGNGKPVQYVVGEAARIDRGAAIPAWM